MPDNTKPLISAHIFVFPFKWRIRTDSSAHSFVPFREKVDMDRIKKIIDDTGQWNPFTFVPQPEAPYFNSYNEYAYFHDYTREVLGVNYKPLPEEETGVMAQYAWEN